MTGSQRVLTGTAKLDRAAHRLVHELITKATAAGELNPSDATLNDLIGRWLELAGPAEASTRVTYLGYIRNHVEPDIGRVRLSRLRAEDLDGWYRRLRNRGLAPASVRKCHVIVTGASSQGRRWGWVTTNVAQLASPPSGPKPVIRTPDADQVRRMLAAHRGLGPRVRCLPAGGGGDWCPSGRDVWAGLVGPELGIRRSHDPPPGQPNRDTPQLVDLTKTHKTRVVPLDAGTVGVLRRHRDEALSRAELCGMTLHPDAHVFSSDPAGGVFWQPASVSHRFRTILRQHGLEHVTCTACGIRPPR